jgi:hypothetical protein
MPNENNQPQAVYTKNLPKGSGSGFAPASQAAGSTGVPQAPGNAPKKKQSKIFGVDSKAVMAVLGLGLFFVVAMAGVLISQKQRLDEDATAPTAPKSQPAANIEKPVTCSLTFTVSEPEVSPTPTDAPDLSPTPTDAPELSPTPTPAPSECGYQGCEEDDDCDTDLVCLTTDDGNNYCAMPEYEDACVAYATEDDAETYCCLAPTVTPSVTPSPTPTPAPNECGYEGCNDDSDCEGDLVCITAYDDNNYCTMPEYAQSCIENATSDDAMPYCCTAPTATPTPKPGATATPTLPPGVTATTAPEATPTTTTTTVITTVSCNDTCTVNADCTNISHICYNGRCRLDSNPENESCQTPSGGTTVVVAQPTLPAELPVSGFEDLANYFKIGLGALGAGLLLLLFL